MTFESGPGRGKERSTDHRISVMRQCQHKQVIDIGTTFSDPLELISASVARKGGNDFGSDGIRRHVGIQKRVVVGRRRSGDTKHSIEVSCGRQRIATPSKGQGRAYHIYNPAVASVVRQDETRTRE